MTSTEVLGYLTDPTFISVVVLLLGSFAALRLIHGGRLL
jgi:hypothetical protein